MNNSYILVCLFTFATTMAKGETRDSILTEPQPKEIALKPLTIDADMSARPGGDYHIKRHGEKVEEGRASALLKTQLKASGTVWRKGFTRIDVGGSYTYYHHELDGRDLRLYGYGYDRHSHHTFGANISATTYLRLFGKPLMLNAMGNTTFSNHGYERWSAALTALLMLKNTKETVFGVGVLGLVHSSVRIPFYPMITYRQVLSPQWTINCVMPRFQMEYNLTPRDMFSAGFSIDVDNYFLETDDERLPERVNYCRTNVNIGPAYEHRFPYGLLFRAEAGAQWVVADRLYKNRNNHVEGRIHEKSAPYIKIGIQKKF